MNLHRKTVLFLGDTLAVGVAFIAVLLRQGKLSFLLSVFTENIWAFLFVSIITFLMIYAFDLYDFRFIRIASENLWRLAGVVLLSPIISVIFFYTLNVFHVTPKTNLAVFFAVFTIMFILWRRAFFRIFSTSFQNKTVVWGSSLIADQLFTEMTLNPHRGYQPFLLVRDTDALTNALEKNDFHVLIIEESFQLPDHLIEIIFKKKITTLSLLSTYESILQKVPVASVDETLFIQNIQHRKSISKFLYRVFEYSAVIIILIIASPFLLVAAIAIKIEDGGSFFYKQARMGYLGEEFMLYKFRSMTEEHRRKDTGTDWTTKNDARITRVGKILRVLHIDEIPQMINVLKGDITLVGPRPDVMRVELDLKNTVPHYHLRHIVKPGFTGWAQIKYRAPNNHEAFIERFEYDMYYIKHQEFFFDIGIMIRTLQIILSHAV